MSAPEMQDDGEQIRPYQEEHAQFGLAMARRGDKLAFRLSALGERRGGYGWLIYNPGVMRIYQRYARADSRAVIAALISEYPSARRWADVGAGTGAHAAEASRAGRDVVGYELSMFGRMLGRAQGARMKRFDLTRPQPVGGGISGVDLAYCFEVAEHLDPRLGDRLVDFLTRLAPVMVFTAAHPGQGGVGHINERPKEYWVNRFEHQGARYDTSGSNRLAHSFREHGVRAPWLVTNLMVFRSG
jgi:SAM-dependent methyltransferase